MNLTIKTDKRLYKKNNLTFCYFTNFRVNFFLVILFGKKNTMKLYLQRETKYITFFNSDKTLKMSIKKNGNLYCSYDSYGFVDFFMKSGLKVSGYFIVVKGCD